MPNPGRIRITKNSNLTTPLIDYRGVTNNFIEWDGQFQITEFANDDYLEFDFEENEWYFNLYATLPGANLADLLDVEFVTLVDTDTLIYDSNSGKWINSNKLTEAIQDIGAINQQISTINQTNIDQQNDINQINDSLDLINQQLGATGDTSSSLGFVPEGGIIMWSGTTVPDDWVLCNGINSTPNLIDKFIIGGYLGNVNSTGLTGSTGSSTGNISPSIPFYTLAFIMRREGFVTSSSVGGAWSGDDILDTFADPQGPIGGGDGVVVPNEDTPLNGGDFDPNEQG